MGKLVINLQNRNLFLFSLLFLSLISLNSSKTITESKINDICSNSDDYINNYYDENQELNETNENLNFNSSFSIKDDYLLKMLFLNKNSADHYKQKRIKKYNYHQIFFIFVLFISFVIDIIFNIHFALRLFERREELEIQDKNATLSKFWKISPFCWIKYLIHNRAQIDSFYNEYRERNIQKLSKTIKISFLLVAFIILIISITLAIFNIIKSNKSEKLVNNMTCALMKFIYEIKEQPFRNSSYIGLDKIIPFLNNSKNNVSELNIKNFKVQFPKETSNKFSEWNSYLNNLVKKLGDQKEKEFYIETYYSQKDYQKEDIENVEKTLFQLININKYYPTNDSTKILYHINNFFHDNVDDIFNAIKKIYDFITKNQIKSVKNENQKTYNIYENIISQLSQIIDIYIDEFTNNYLPNFHNILIKKYFSLILIVDFTYLGMIGLCCLLFAPLMQYFFNKKYFNTKLLIPIIFYNNLFLLLILSLFGCTVIVNIKKKIIYISDISKVICYLFDKDNQEYLGDTSFYYTINDINFSVMDEDGIYKNIFYYLNYIINSNSNITDLFNINYTNININQISDLYLQLKNFTYNKSNLLYINLTNPIIDNFSKELSIIIKEGISPYTNFKDVAEIGYDGSGLENPMNYLSYINIRTRQENQIKDFDCDETWNLSTYNFDHYFYRNRYIVIDCEKCINHYYKKDELFPPALLNFLEYSLEEIKERYSDLLDRAPEIYYGIVYQATALNNFLKNDTVIKQVKKLLNYNEYLKTLQTQIFESIKQSFFQGKEIISYFQNLSQNYTNYTNITFGDLLNCNFVKKDLLFILKEIELSINNLDQYYQLHLLVYGMSITLASIFIIFYSLISYEIPFEKGKVENKDTLNDQYAQHIRDLITQKKLEIFKSKDLKDHNSSKGLLTFGNNINIIQEGNINNNDNNLNNLNPRYNTVIYDGENKIYNEKDILSLNNQVSNNLIEFNKFFNQTNKNNVGKKNLTVVEEEKEEDSNAIDQSRNQIIEKELKYKISSVERS